MCAVRLGESPASGPEIPWQTTREYTTSIARVPSPTVNLANPRTREPANPRTLRVHVAARHQIPDPPELPHLDGRAKRHADVLLVARNRSGHENAVSGEMLHHLG